MVPPLRYSGNAPTPVGADNLTLRTATKADLDGLTRVAQAGFPDDPEWNYRFPHRKEFPEDNWKWTRREYEEYLDQPEKYAVLVVTLKAAVEIDGKVESKLAALAVWDISVLTESTGGGKVFSLNTPLRYMSPYGLTSDRCRLGY